MPRGHWARAGLGVALLFLAAACGTAPGASLPQVPDLNLPTSTPWLRPPAPFGQQLVLPTETPTAVVASPTPRPTATALPTATPIIPLEELKKTPTPATTVLGHGLGLPPGFKVELYAGGLDTVSSLAYSPDGVLFASLPGRGTVVAMPDEHGNGRADGTAVFVGGLVKPSGLAFHGGYLYVAEAHQVVRFQYQPGMLSAASPAEVVVPGLPVGNGHSNHVISVGPDEKLYVSIGSSCNACQEADPRRATIMRYNLDGSQAELYAQGLRDVEGLAWYPNVQQPLVTNCSRSGMGEDLPPDTIEMAFQGANFGWPFCHAGDIPDPELGWPDACNGVPHPFLQLPAKTTPHGLMVYTGSQFPPEYYGDLFVALYGSWERKIPVGYKIVRIHLEEGKVARVEDFATGWLVFDQFWGRPTDLIEGRDGSLLVSDDWAGAVYRIYYAP